MLGVDIINEILADLKLNTKQFSESLGLERPQLIYNIINGKSKDITKNTASIIRSKYPNYNPAWLMTGEGKKYLNNDGDKYINALKAKPTNLDPQLPTENDQLPNSISYENLTRSNLVLAEAQLAGAKVQQTIADNNTALIMLLSEKSRFVAHQDTPSIEIPTIALVDLLADIASGVKYDSKDAALFELNKRIYGKKENSALVDIQAESGKSNKA